MMVSQFTLVSIVCLGSLVILGILPSGVSQVSLVLLAILVILAILVSRCGNPLF